MKLIYQWLQCPLCKRTKCDTHDAQGNSVHAKCLAKDSDAAILLEEVKAQETRLKRHIDELLSQIAENPNVFLSDKDLWDVHQFVGEAFKARISLPTA